MRGFQAPQAAGPSAMSSLPSRVRGGLVLLSSLAALAAGCGDLGEADASTPGTLATATAGQALSAEALSAALAKPVGLALEVANGEGKPLQVRAGQTFYVNQIDLSTIVPTGDSQGVEELRRGTDFAGMGWGGVRLADEETALLPGPTGYIHRRFYRSAAWMEVPSFFTVEPVDAQGRLTALPVVLRAGGDDKRRDSDDFFIRRFRAIHTTSDCISPSDCTGAHLFQEEALVELRNARTEAKAQTFTFTPNTVALRLRWNLSPVAPYTIPVTQVARPPYDYGFAIDIAARTPPRADGTFAPGSTLTFQMTLKDGSGQRLHPQGCLPSYNEVAFGENPAGIQYYRAFFDATTTYYRRKHRERNFSAEIIGPAQKVQPVRNILDLDAFLGPDDVFTVATPERDGLFVQATLIPPANKLFGDPLLHNGGWAAPVSDSFTFTLPANAEPGTYYVSAKARRTYMGEDVPASGTIAIQVGTPTPTHANLFTGNCNNCHVEGGELNTVLHAQGNRATCAGCHTPLGFELEGPIFVRLHFIHSRSDRFDVPTSKCTTCHLTPEPTQRTSKAACLSCHKSYPADHVQAFGKIESMYVGGGRESFQQCTTSCHKTHPGSGF